MLQKFLVTIVGTTPLLQNRFNDEKNLDTRGDPRECCQRRLYVNAAGQVIQPAAHIYAALRVANDLRRKCGKAIDLLTVSISPCEIVHEFQIWVVDQRPVKLFQRRYSTIRYRPRLDTWALKFYLEFDDAIKKESLVDLLEFTGTYVGIGDHRPTMGKFYVERFEAA